MNAFGLSILFTMGCTCGKQSVEVGSKKYTVKSRLGEGGFSVVDLVQDPDTRKHYALKRVVCHCKEDEKTALQEAEYYKAFNQPNIISLVDVSLSAKHDVTKAVASEARILLPYYKRGTLQDELNMRSRNREQMSEQRVLHLFRQMCEGVRSMHCAQPYPLAHRDLKPANVLLADDDTPVWMDFGSMGKARVEIRKSSEAQALQDLAAEKCSMPYKAPELFNVESHSSVDERVDIWSLGCCLYALCYFKSPFESIYERGDSIALAVIGGNIDFPEQTTFSGSLHGLIRSLLEVNSLQRPFIDAVIQQVDGLSSALHNQV